MLLNEPKLRLKSLPNLAFWRSSTALRLSLNSMVAINDIRTRIGQSLRWFFKNRVDNHGIAALAETVSRMAETNLKAAEQMLAKSSIIFNYSFVGSEETKLDALARFCKDIILSALHKHRATPEDKHYLDALNEYLIRRFSPENVQTANIIRFVEILPLRQPDKIAQIVGKSATILQGELPDKPKDFQQIAADPREMRHIFLNVVKEKLEDRVRGLFYYEIKTITDLPAEMITNQERKERCSVLFQQYFLMHRFPHDLFTDGVTFLTAFIHSPFSSDDLAFLLKAIHAIVELLKAAKNETETPPTQLVLTRSRLIFDGLFKAIIPHQGEMISHDAKIDIPAPYSSIVDIGEKSSIKAVYAYFLKDHLRRESKLGNSADIMADVFSSFSIPPKKVGEFCNLLWDSRKVLGAYLSSPELTGELKEFKKEGSL